jgi:hypothetical protein
MAGTASVLLSLAPHAPTGPSQPMIAAAAPRVAESPCPPCERGPLGPIGWLHAASAQETGSSLVRAAALSLAMGEPQVVQLALEADDPALRELAALLLNVASGRVAGCTPLGDGGHVAAVLDRLDRLLAQVRAGEPVPAADLSAAASAAAVLNRGEGLPADCSG